MRILAISLLKLIKPSLSFISNLTLTFFDLGYIIVRKGQKVKSQKRSNTVGYALKS